VEGIERKELVPFHYWGVPDTVDFEPIPWRGGRFDPVELEKAVETQERAQSALDEWREHGGERTLAFCASTSHSDFMARFFEENGVSSASVHSKASSAPRHESLESLRDGSIQVVFAVDLFNEGLDVPEIDTVLMLRPTESPVVFLQQLGRGLRIMDGKAYLQVVDFIGNHRSFLSKPRTLLSLGMSSVPSTEGVLTAIESGDFGLPPECSVDYELDAVNLLRTLAKKSGGSPITEYCRSYFEEEGIRPSATQAFHAGHNVRSVRAKHGSWFEFLNDSGLLSDQEKAAVEACSDVLRGFEVETVQKSYKLLTLRALLHEGVLRTGLDVATIARVASKMILRDPRLIRDLSNSEYPDLESVEAKGWEKYWRKWPIAAWTGELSGKAGEWFEMDGNTFSPKFEVEEQLGDVFDAMAAELVEFRLASYLAGKDRSSSNEWSCKVSHTDGSPIVLLDRIKAPDLPEGAVEFNADGDQYEAKFAKGALTIASRSGQDGNGLPALLRSWFGPSAGQPGTGHFVTLGDIDGSLVLRPAAERQDFRAELIPLFPSFEVACGGFPATEWMSHGGVPIQLQPIEGAPPLDPGKQFVCFARGDSMDGGATPIRHGDPLLFEWIESGSRRDFIDQKVLVNFSDSEGVSSALKTLRREGDHYALEASNPTYPSITGQKDMKLVATLTRKLVQVDVNPIAEKIGESFKRNDIPPLYGLEYNPGNWQSGHVSLKGQTVLFVTLEKGKGMGEGADYVDHFESPQTFVWSSQNSTSPTGKKGREILESLESGTAIDLWARRKKSKVAFIYLGRVIPISHEGERPMSVTYRMLTPVEGEIWKRLHG